MAELNTPSGTQTLLRGLAVLQAVAAGAHDLKAIGQALGTSRSTTHRLASALVEARYLRLLPASGYRLGPRLIELGYQAREAVPLVALAEPWLAQLASATGDTLHLAVREADEVLYLQKIPGRHGPEMRSRVGQRMPLLRTGIGKALLLDADAAQWRRLYDATAGLPAAPGHPPLQWEALAERMAQYVAGQYAFDLEDNEPSIRCVAAPVRDASGRVVAAISVASTVPYMPLEKMQRLVPQVQAAAHAISAELGAR